MIANWLPEDYLKTIVLFEVSNEKGELVPHGTGVLLNYKDVFVLATCKHIVVNPQTRNGYLNLHATVNRVDGSRSRKNLDLIHKQFGLKWFFHKELDVDLALSPIVIEEGVDDIKLISLNMFEEYDQMPLGDDIFFLGYPLGLGTNNLTRLSPLLRSGLIASKDLNKKFLIDANVYPGSSGSPVFYKPVLAVKKEGATNIGSSRDLKFLGLVSDNISTTELAISPKTGRVRTTFEENSGLGIVQSTALIEEILNYPELQVIIPPTQQAQIVEENK